MGNRGQVVLEYILIIAVIALMAWSIFPKIGQYLIGSDNCRRPRDPAIFCRLLASTGLDAQTSGNYRRFVLRRF